MFTTLSFNPSYEELTTSLRELHSLLSFATHTDLACQSLEDIFHLLSTLHNLSHQVVLNCENLGNLKILC